MQINCPHCGADLPTDALDVAGNRINCPICLKSATLSDLLQGKPLADDQIDLSNPPKGAWFENSPDGIRVGVSHRFLPLLVFLVPFTMIWSGGSLGGIYGGQLRSGNFSILLSLFGLPFLFGTFVLLAVIAMCAGGKTEVTITPDQATIFQGAFGVGWRRRFDPALVTKVYDEVIPNTANLHRRIVIETSEKTLKIHPFVGTSADTLRGKNPAAALANATAPFRFLFNVLRNYLQPRS